MLAEGLIICAMWSGAVLLAVDGAWLGSYVAANNDRPEGMPSYFADEKEKEMYALKLQDRAGGPPGEYEYNTARQPDTYSEYSAPAPARDERAYDSVLERDERAYYSAPARDEHTYAAAHQQGPTFGAHGTATSTILA
mmetsp:Transcript_42871/g.68830  ORF Transcript_42871/g.68830 Transcript_42871/m.68830 type:complete len:138 (-) Transcript_42871:185-598(-)|eukprot:CAMPEP_0179450496 /NCGR_PEP_ID=MMETSP0799-20121207/34459_1 /TAXON_ID=46947 /ORGANISM="Geminigera cryophila, Strain CCMP2564" /LENGTH=137 /DNA_ID=CAMNT_0021244631 /DNA_START=68 /DNA_END=481 /DNA_ORIENTATION=-